jgi:hypothetical protein
VPKDGEAPPPETNDEGASDADKPVTHAELPGLIKEALTDFFGEATLGEHEPDDDDDGVAGEGSSGGSSFTFQDVEDWVESRISDAVAKLQGEKKPAGKKAAAPKAAAPKREPESVPEPPRRVDARRKFWGRA